MRTYPWAYAQLTPMLVVDGGAAPGLNLGAPLRLAGGADALAHRWAALLAALLLSTGCVTLTPRQGGSLTEGSRALSSLREAGTSMLPLEVSAPLDSPEVGRHSLSAEASAPPGGLDFSSNDSEALLAPFLACTSPAEYVALQERVDMLRLVESLTDWDAVRLGPLGPVREDAAGLLNRKRLSFILHATDTYGIAHAEVFVRFLLDSAYDDELREILFWLAREKRLESTLGLMPRARAELEARGLKLSVRPDRDFQPGDLPRGVGRAVTDLLTHEQEKNAWYTHYTRQRGQLPPSYQQDLDEVEREAAKQHYSAGNVVLGSVDHLTFGVPLGFYYLAAGTGHGLYSLSQGEYEQAMRELTPLALLATLYVGGKGVRTVYEARGGGVGALAEKARQLQAQLGTGVEGLRELVRYIQARREAGRFVAVGGVDAALALYGARGDVAKARPLMSKVRSGATGSPPAKSGEGDNAGKAAAAADDAAHFSPKQALTAEYQGTLASLVDEGVGHTREVVESKLAAVELEATGPRLPTDTRVLKQHRPALDAPPPEARGDPRWREYVDYYEKRFSEVKKGEASKGPLKWEGYERLRKWFARGLAFERDMVTLLKADAEKPRAERRFLGDFDRPRLETQVGVRKPGPGLRYADVLVIEEGGTGGQPRRVETLSFKSRDLSRLDPDALTARVIEDAREALRKYGERLDIRRESLQSLFPDGSEVRVSRVRLIYEGGELRPAKIDDLDSAVTAAEQAVPGVEVLFQ
ncbi:hypothetical protein ATI61_116191 [Archangium gephyra]|uniref:Uncharacterized protein n=1 Tax=Archangium gephyra TaxID=48 RepID=A0AAC8QAU5_9BACT|nr:hypothetical protein [Archangium gephyra]AKJ03944.1 Hypothetical protein AA314_05570 [Archangium gephyra]REG23719.1 hypothetical protein ATI61_116191 [Archangium gephyra]